MYNSAWKRARIAAAKAHAQVHEEPIEWGFANLRVHDLKHTFGRRLRSAGVSLETRKVLLGHTNGDITSHYSAPEIEELLEAAARVFKANPVTNNPETKNGLGLTSLTRYRTYVKFGSGGQI